MEVTRSSPARVSRARFAWIEEQSAAWLESGLIDEPTRRRILDSYAVESSERRGMTALVLVAVLMCGIGLLLLIGYNWARIPAAVKVALVCGLVAAAFIASAVAYARNRSALGEILAFAGTFVFGNGIWLIADVLHIQGYFPDGFWWFAIGALATALLLRSRYAGFGAAVLFGLWIIVDGASSEQPSFSFVAIWPLLVLHAYRVRSPAMLGVIAFLAPLWVLAATSDDSAVWLGATVLTAGAVYFAGAAAHEDASMKRAWQTTGLAALLLLLVPLMVADIHEDLAPVRPMGASMAIGAAAGAFALWRALTRTQDVKDLGVACVIAATAVWAVVIGAGLVRNMPATAISATILFSAAVLGLAVSLIRAALRSSHTHELVFGVLFALAFLVVRWVSVLENLLWSGALLLGTGAALLWIARMWRRREVVRAAAGSAS